MIKNSFLATLFVLTIASCVFYSCTKDVGPNPLLDKDLGFSDEALYDSCKNAAAFTYYKNSNTVLVSSPGTTGSPHGDFRLKFNKIATAVLGADGKLPTGQAFPDGSMVVKETVVGKYAFTFKRNGSWIWGILIQQNGAVEKSVKAGSDYCTDCHKFAGRDQMYCFDLY